MATTDVARPNIATRAVGFLKDVKGEMDKVTWPDKEQFRQLCVYVVIFAVLVGLLIAAMDFVLQGIFVQLLPSLVGR